MRKSIYNAGKKNNPLVSKFMHNYENLKEFCEHLMKNNNKIIFKENNKESELTAVPLVSGQFKKVYHVIIYDKEWLESFNEQNEIFIDGTFRTRPSNIKGVSQLLTIKAKKNDVVSI